MKILYINDVKFANIGLEIKISKKSYIQVGFKFCQLLDKNRDVIGGYCFAK